MATTTYIKIIENDWTEVSLSKRGQISNITDTLISYVQADEKPDASENRGHHLTPHEILKYTLEPISRIFMRSIRGDGLIALSAGSTFFDCCDIILPDNFIFNLSPADNFVFQGGINFELN